MRVEYVKENVVLMVLAVKLPMQRRLVAARRLGELPQVGQRAAMQPVAGLREPPKVAARAGASL